MNRIEDKELMLKPAADIYEKDDSFVVLFDVPGADREKIDITVENNSIQLNAPMEESDAEFDYREYGRGVYSRTFTFNEDVDSNSIHAELEEGVLSVTLGKKEELKPKKIEVQVH